MGQTKRGTCIKNILKDDGILIHRSIGEVT